MRMLRANHGLFSSGRIVSSGGEVLTPGYPSATELADIPGLVALWDATSLIAGSLSGSSTIPNLVNPSEPLTFGSGVFDRAATTFDGRTYVVLKAGSGYTGADVGRMRCAGWFGSGTRQTGQYAFILLGAGSSDASAMVMGCNAATRRQLSSIVNQTNLYNNNFASGSAQVLAGVHRRQNRLSEPSLIGGCNYTNASSQIVENVDYFPEHDLVGEGNFTELNPTFSRTSGATRVNATSGEDMLIGGAGTSFFAAAVLDLTGVSAADRETNYRNALALMWNHFVLKGRSMVFFAGDSLTDCRTILDAIPGTLDPYSEPGWPAQIKSVIRNRYVVRNLAAAGMQFQDRPGNPAGNTSPVSAGFRNILNRYVQLCKYRSRPLQIHAMQALGFNGVYDLSVHVAELKLWASDVRSYEGSGVTTKLHWIRTPTSIDSLVSKNVAMEAEFDGGTSGYDFSYFDGMAAQSDSMFHNPDPGYDLREYKKLNNKYLFWQQDNRIPGYASTATQTATVTTNASGNATVTFTPLGADRAFDFFASTNPAIIANGSTIADAGLLTNFIGRFTTSPQVIENLQPSTTYYFMIAGVDALHANGPSFDYFAQTYLPMMAPNLGVSVLPAGGGMTLRAVAGNAQIALTMSSIPGATHYEWHRASGATLLEQFLQSPDLHGGTTLIATTTSPTFTDTTVSNGTWYHYHCVGRTGSPGSYTYSPISTRASNLPAVTPAIPVNTTAPVISGGIVADEVLTTTKGKYSGTYVPYEWYYQWTRNGVAISGATATTYTIQPGDVGANIRCEVTSQNCIGYSVAAASNAVVPLAGSVARRQFVGYDESSADQTVYTFSAEPIGAARSDRQVLLCVHARKASATAITATATINGVSTTVVQQVHNATGGAANYAGMFMLNVPTGTTGDIVITFNAAVLRVGMQIYRLTGLASTTPVDTYSGTTTLSDTLTISTNSVVIGAANRGSGSITTVWTGITEDHEDTLVGGESLTATSASAEVASSGTLAVSVALGGSALNDTILLAVWA